MLHDGTGRSPGWPGWLLRLKHATVTRTQQHIYRQELCIVEGNQACRVVILDGFKYHKFDYLNN